MAEGSIYFVGTREEVQHHARPLCDRVDLKLVEPEDVIQSAEPGDIALFFSEHFDRFREACRALKERQVGTIYAIDGILEWRNAWENRDNEPACPWTMRPALAHKVACIGRSQARVLADWGNAEKIEVVGVPRFDALFHGALECPVPQSGPIRILVMTAKWPGFTDEQVAITTRSLLDLKQWFDQNGEIKGRPIEVTWRLTRGLESQLDVENQMNDATGAELARSLSEVDAVITTASTAMLEAMIAQRPVALLDYHNCPRYVEPAFCISAREHIETVIHSMANPPAPRMLFQQAVLSDALECQTPATDRMVTLIEKMRQIAGDCVREDRPLEFPPYLVPLESGSHASFNLASTFPNVPEFGENDPIELQAELAHARREIAHLHAQLDQLSAELGEAHQIFEQIHKHPLAGPVVRIRQRILDAIAAFSKRKSDSKTDPQDISG